MPPSIGTSEPRTYSACFGNWDNAQDRDRDCYTSGALSYCNVQARPCMEGSDYPGGVNKNTVYE